MAYRICRCRGHAGSRVEVYQGSITAKPGVNNAGRVAGRSKQTGGLDAVLFACLFTAQYLRYVLAHVDHFMLHRSLTLTLIHTTLTKILYTRSSCVVHLDVSPVTRDLK